MDEKVPATQGPVYAGLFYYQSLTVTLNDWSCASGGLPWTWWLKNKPV